MRLVLAALTLTVSLSLGACSLFVGEGLTGGSDASSVDGGRVGDDALGAGDGGNADAAPVPVDGATGTDAASGDPNGVPIDGDFEQKGLGCGPGWTSSAGASLGLVTSPRSGALACRICGTGGGSGVTRTFADGVQGPGRYQATLWYRAETGNGPGYYALRADQASASTSSQVAYESQAGDVPSWKSIQALFVVDKGAWLSMLNFYFDGDGCVLVDDATLLYQP